MDKNDNLIELIAEKYLNFTQDLKSFLKELTDEELISLRTKIREKFRISEFWVLIADRISKELFYRQIGKAANQYFKDTGNTWYCPWCKCACDPESESHNQNFVSYKMTVKP